MFGSWIQLASQVFPKLNEEPSLFEELWAYFQAKYFSMQMGNYENIHLGSGSLVTMQKIIFGLCIGIVIAAVMVAYDKRVLGGFVRKIIKQECFSANRAMTLSDLGYMKSASVRNSLKRGTVLSKVVRCVEKEQYDLDIEEARAAYAEKNGDDKGFVAAPFRIDFTTAHFYIPDDDHYAADIRFDAKGSGWRSFLLVIIGAIVLAFMLAILLPDMLQLVDNLIGVLKGSGNGRM